MTTMTEAGLTVKDLADRIGLSPRMINIYRAEAEARLGRKLGHKEGRQTVFYPEDVREVLKSRDAGNEGNTGTSQKFRETPNFSQQNNQAEAGVLTGMEAMVATGDQKAIATGAELGQRWNELMWASAIQTMQVGMVQMTQQFSELHTSLDFSFSQPQLPGGEPTTLQFAPADEDLPHD